jgi:hypothetical protein
VSSRSRSSNYFYPRAVRVTHSAPDLPWRTRCCLRLVILFVFKYMIRKQAFAHFSSASFVGTAMQRSDSFFCAERDFDLTYTTFNLWLHF